LAFFFIFFHSTFDVGRSMFDVHFFSFCAQTQLSLISETQH